MTEEDDTEVPADNSVVELDFAPSAVESEALVVDVEGYEGPLDLLLALAKAQKVDLAKISILALAEQYLSFISDVRKVRLEIAADYLVMAAWLAYLKSRLLLPAVESDEEGPDPAELAARLPRGRRVDMANAGHLIPAERPEALADHLIRFAEEV